MVSASAQTVYILHITEQSGEVWHYVGITKRRRFEQRMREHKNHHGSVIVRAAHARGCAVEVGCTNLSGSTILETALARTPHVWMFCNLCSARGTHGRPYRARWGPQLRPA